LPSRWHARGSSCGTASRSGSPRSWVRWVVRYLAPLQRSSSSLSPHLLSRLLYAFFSRKVLRLSIRKEERGSWIFIVHPLTFTDHIWPLVLFKKFVKM
jgi:hypothetical protein